MMMPQLLLRGMMVGVLAGLLAFSFAKIYGEPQVDRAIEVESAIAKAKGEVEYPEIISRAMQSTIGLFTGVVVVGGALGGIFSLLFALLWGRFATALTPKGFAALLGLIAFMPVYIVPDLKYPANPPSIGEPETIGIRTGLYFSMIAISIIAILAAFSLRKVFVPRLGGWNATLVGALSFAVMIATAYYALPVVNEVPEVFPAQTLWKFRLASMGIQAILWGGISLMFGALTERGLAREVRSQSSAFRKNDGRSGEAKSA